MHLTCYALAEVEKKKYIYNTTTAQVNNNNKKNKSVNRIKMLSFQVVNRKTHTLEASLFVCLFNVLPLILSLSSPSPNHYHYQ